MQTTAANREQIEHWNRAAGPVWVAYQERLDRQLEAHGARLLQAARLAPGERVLDVGCGCGASTLAAARQLGASGRVLGVDVSAPMLSRARERAAADGLAQAQFLRADAQRARLPEADFDAVLSRFGVMFFADPGAAFANLRSALRPGGRLAFVCWAAATDNPWVSRPLAAVASLLVLPPPPAPGSPGMFSLADPERMRALLAAAGFAAIELAALALPMQPGAGGVEEALDFYLGVGPVAGLLREQAAPGLEARVREALRLELERSGSERGGAPSYDSLAWCVTAERPAP